MTVEPRLASWKIGVLAVLWGACAEATSLDGTTLPSSDTVSRDGGDVSGGDASFHDGIQQDSAGGDGHGGESDGTMVGDGRSEETLAPPDGGGGDTTPPPDWEVVDDGAWRFGRPIPLTGRGGAVSSVGTPISLGEFALTPMFLSSGSLETFGNVHNAPDGGAHAVVVVTRGELEAAPFGSVERVLYLDGDLSADQAPLIAVCADAVFAVVNGVDGQGSRFIRLSRDLESLQVATFSALPGLGHSVRLGAPVCGGPGVVVPLDAVGGARFGADDGRSSTFTAAQTDGRTVIVQGTKVFGEGLAQVISVSSMRITHLVAGPGQRVLYAGKATEARTLGEVTLAVGDQLVYQHDYATATGGAIASQVWQGGNEITGLFPGPAGGFLVAWRGPTGAAGTTGTTGTTMTPETALTLFSASGSRVWVRRGSGWQPEVARGQADGTVVVAGTMATLAALGSTRVSVGRTDAFVAVLAADDGAALRTASWGDAGDVTRLGSEPFFVKPAPGCETEALLTAVVAWGSKRAVAVGVASDGVRCQSAALMTGEAPLFGRWAEAAAEPGFEAWVGRAASTLGVLSASGVGWPEAESAMIGRLRGRIDSPL